MKSVMPAFAKAVARHFCFGFRKKVVPGAGVEPSSAQQQKKWRFKIRWLRLASGGHVD
jgi:hypothetical protein